ncbi:DUF2975 domain-containing protein [uncultured Lacinutrix sp.]|uniref:DUF2975 domain-containing protein n=1 Tax=uncultured Lacinutrix sp. TaxID=574032 RepID=UPI0026355E12|nr:DUF2975 domain-containing protein [uncultured Lacinutrix sp.]
MKKLNILKSLVDFIWIFTCIPLILLLLFVSVFVFIDSSITEAVLNVDTSEVANSSASVIITTLVLATVLLIGIYCFYLFRKTLRYFQQRKPFHDYVIATYHKMGNLLVATGIVATVLFFVIKLIFESRFEIHLGLTPYVFIVCLGLFFMVLSEIFKIAKTAKQENDLTI